MSIWGTDIEFDDSLSVSGEGSIKFLSTTPADDTTFTGDWFPIDRGVATNAHLYLINTFTQASSTTAGDVVQIDFLEYSADRQTLLYTNNIYNDVLGAIDTWESLGEVVQPASSTSKWGRIRLTKNNTAFTANFDRVDIAKLAPRARQVLDNDQTGISASTWTTVAFDAGAGAGIDINTTTGVATCRRAGLYMISPTVAFDAGTGGDTVKIRVVRERGSPGVESRYQVAGGIDDAADPTILSGSIVRRLHPGDLVYIDAYTVGASDILTLAGGASHGYSTHCSIVSIGNL